MLKRIPLMRPLALSSVLWALLSGQAGAEGPMLSNLGVPPEWKSWDRMTVTAPRFMSNTKTLQLPDFLMKLWVNEIAANDDKYREDNNAQLIKNGHAPAEALYSVYQDSGQTVIVSILNTAKYCQNGPNDAASTQLHSVCPVRVTVVRGQASSSVDYPDACFLDITYGNPPGGPNPVTNATLTRYDRQAGMVDLIAIRDNRSLPQCAKRLKVPVL